MQLLLRPSGNAMKFPLDRTPYKRHRRSCPIHLGLPSGSYVYVQDTDDVVHVIPDGPYLHPKVLGRGLPAHYAGDLTIEEDTILEVTNLSGTFQFDDPGGLLAVADVLAQMGFKLRDGAVRLFPNDGRSPIVLR